MRKWRLLTAALDPADPRPLYMQLSNAIAEDIRKGRLKPGDPLPGTRVLAQQLRIHRNTAIAGYQELIAQGLVSARSGGGTFVATVVPPLAGPGRIALRSGRPTFPVASPIPPVPMTPPDPGGPLTLVRAIPDVRLLPAEALSRAFRRAISRHGRKLLGYADPRGHPLLRQGLATMLSHARGLPTSKDDLVVTRGSQQAVYLDRAGAPLGGGRGRRRGAGKPPRLARAPAARDRAGTRAGGRGRAGRLRPRGAPRPAEAARRLRDPAPPVSHQHRDERGAPRTPRSSRAEAPLRDHRGRLRPRVPLRGSARPPIAAGPDAENVLYVGTLSKVLAPGLRVGFVLAPPEIRERLVSLRAVCDMQGDTAVECAVAELFEDGELVRHVRRMSRIYLRRRDALAEALQRMLGGAVSVRVPQGGMALWVRVADDIDLPAWERAGESLGVVFRGAGMFDFAERPRPFLRLGFTYHDESEPPGSREPDGPRPRSDPDRPARSLTRAQRPSYAAFSFAMSSFTICSIAFATRFTRATSLSASISSMTRGTICQQRP